MYEREKTIKVTIEDPRASGVTTYTGEVFAGVMIEEGITKGDNEYCTIDTMMRGMLSMNTAIMLIKTLKEMQEHVVESIMLHYDIIPLGEGENKEEFISKFLAELLGYNKKKEQEGGYRGYIR